MLVIQLNSHGPDAADWQKFLRKQAFNPGPADGVTAYSSFAQGADISGRVMPV